MPGNSSKQVKPKIAPAPYSTEQKQEAAWELYVKGYGTREIGEILGLTQRRIQMLIKDKKESFAKDPEALKNLVAELYDGFRYDLKELYELLPKVKENVKPQIYGQIKDIRTAIWNKTVPDTIHQITQETVVEAFDEEDVPDLKKCPICNGYHEGKCLEEPVENK